MTETKEQAGRDGHDPDSDRARWAVIFGWIAGASVGLLLSYAFFIYVGGTTATSILTFVLLISGAFAGTTIADRFGSSAFRQLGISAGISLAAVITLLLVALMQSAS
jgi:uncharacterized membrane protein